MSHICLKCNDTGSLSKLIDADLDCHYCDATEKRLAMRNHISQFTGWPESDVTAWAAYLFAQRQTAPVAAQPAMPKLPSTPEEVVAFIGSNFTCLYDAGPVEDHDYTMSVHDLLSSFQDLVEESKLDDPDDMAANYDHSTHDKRMEVLKGLQAEQPVEVAGQVPDGYVLVPKSPNEEMLRPDGFTHRLVYSQYQAMLAAAPKPAAQPSDDVALKAAVERMQKAHAASNASAKLPAYDEAFEYQAAVHALIKAAVAKEKA